MRRTGAGRAVAVAGLLTLLTGLAAGCSDDDPGVEPAPTTLTRPVVPAGTLRVGVPEEPASLDPFDRRSRSPAALAVLGEVLPQLFRVDPDGRVRGYLAEESTVRPEPQAEGAAFRLRGDARWSDGRPITAADVRFTWETILGDHWPGPRAGYDRVTAVEGDGRAVRLSFDGPFPGWRRLFSGDDFVLPAHRLAGADLATVWRDGPDLAGGPFALGEVTPGLEVELVRNGAWWGEGPRVESLRVLVVPDVRTMEQLLGRGDLDVAWPPATGNRRGRFSALDGVEVEVAEPGGRLVALVANTEAVPVGRRRAVLGLVDRDRFVAVLLDGEARPAVSLAGGVAGAEPAWAEVSADPDGGEVRSVETDTLIAAQEEPLASLLGRVLERGMRRREASLELKFAEAALVDGQWVHDGSFDFAVHDRVGWPEPCWRCWFAEANRGRGNVARVGGLDALTGAAERAEPGAVAALESRLRAEAVLLPLWRPAAVLAGRDVEGLRANSWSSGPFWSATGWAKRSDGDGP